MDCLAAPVERRPCNGEWTVTSRAKRRHARGPALVLAAVVLGTVLSGCSDVRQSFGLDRTVPDEFAVVPRAPLAMPPDLGLPPPQPGIARPQEGTARDRAQAVVLGAEPTTPGETAVQPRGTQSVGEAAFLSVAGAGSALPDIRRVIDQETADLLVADQQFIDRLIFWQEQPTPGIVVDPEAEAARIASNSALGRPLNEGDVPVIERRQRAPLEGIF